MKSHNIFNKSVSKVYFHKNKLHSAQGWSQLWWSYFQVCLVPAPAWCNPLYGVKPWLQTVCGPLIWQAPRPAGQTHRHPLSAQATQLPPLTHHCWCQKNPVKQTDHSGVTIFPACMLGKVISLGVLPAPLTKLSGGEMFLRFLEEWLNHLQHNMHINR